MTRETSFENTAQETSTESCHTVASLELHNDLTHYYNVPGVSTQARPPRGSESPEFKTWIGQWVSTVPADRLLSSSLLSNSQQTNAVTSGMFLGVKTPSDEVKCKQ